MKDIDMDTNDNDNNDNISGSINNDYDQKSLN